MKKQNILHFLSHKVLMDLDGIGLMLRLVGLMNFIHRSINMKRENPA